MYNLKGNDLLIVIKYHSVIYVNSDEEESHPIHHHHLGITTTVTAWSTYITYRYLYDYYRHHCHYQCNTQKTPNLGVLALLHI